METGKMLKYAEDDRTENDLWIDQMYPPAADHVYVPKKDFLYGCLSALTEDNEKETTSPYWRSVMTAPGIHYHLLDKDIELFPGIRLFLLGGHTPAVAAMLLELESKNYLFLSDVCSSRLNYGPPIRRNWFFHTI